MNAKFLGKHKGFMSKRKVSGGNKGFASKLNFMGECEGFVEEQSLSGQRFGKKMQKLLYINKHIYSYNLISSCVARW